MDYLLIILSFLILMAGFVGCFLPVIPGPPLAYLSLIVIHLTKAHSYTTQFLVIWLLIIVGVTILDYVVPPLATRKFGGSRAGVIGSTIGIILGLFILPPWGIIVFPFFGALVGELATGSTTQGAYKAAMGSFLGFLGGVALKLAVTIAIAYQIVDTLT